MFLEAQLREKLDHVIYTRAGPEIGVAATKTYVSQLVSIYMLAIAMSGNDNLLAETSRRFQTI